VDVDYFTKWLEAQPYPQIQTKTVVDFVFKKMFGLAHGKAIMARALSVGQCQFDSKEFDFVNNGI
jgi:hypothetical protein